MPAQELLSSQATREIMWNVSSLPNVVALYGLLVVAMGIALNGIAQRTFLWRSGRTANEFTGNWLVRLDDLIQGGVFQRKVARGKSGSAVAHILVYLNVLLRYVRSTSARGGHVLRLSQIYREPNSSS